MIIINYLFDKFISHINNIIIINITILLILILHVVKHGLKYKKNIYLIYVFWEILNKYIDQ